MPSINETHKLLLRQPYYGELTDPANGHCVIDDIEELETEWPEEVNDYCDDQEYWKDYQLRNNPAQTNFYFHRQELFKLGPEIRTTAFYPNLRKIAAALNYQNVQLRKPESSVGSVREMIKAQVLRGLKVLDLSGDSIMSRHKGAAGCLRAMGAKVRRLSMYEPKFQKLNDLDREIAAISLELIEAIYGDGYDLVFWEESKYYNRFATEDEHYEEQPAMRLRVLESVLNLGGPVIDILPGHSYVRPLKIYNQSLANEGLQLLTHDLKSA